MIGLGLLLTLLVAVGAVRFHEFNNGGTHFHGVPVDKYVAGMNRLREIQHILDGKTGAPIRFEEIDWPYDAESHPMENPFLYDGDIILNEQMLDALVQHYEADLATKEGRHIPNLLSVGVPYLMWKIFPISWTIDRQNPPDGGAENVRQAVKLWEDKTCLSFRENGPSENGIMEFYLGNGCNSPIGSQAAWKTANRISIGERCGAIYTIVHEIDHSLGVWHQQNRYDNSKYVDIFKSNINPNFTHAFDHPEAFLNASSRGIPYDYGSVMHYSRNGFSIDARPTMLPKDRNYNDTIGQHFEISFTDAKEINLLYCDHVCPRKLPCRNGGYTDPKECSRCRCPDGWDGYLCDRARYSDYTCGSPYVTARPSFQTLYVSGRRNCNFKIQAPAGRKLTIILDSTLFQGEDGWFKNCDNNFVEVKYADQYESAGARFCSKNLIGSRIMTSLRNETMVIYRSSNYNFNFSLRYRYE